MYIPLNIDAICSCDAEASLVAISLSSRLFSVEVWKNEALVYVAPPRRDFRDPETLEADTVVHGTA